MSRSRGSVRSPERLGGGTGSVSRCHYPATSSMAVAAGTSILVLVVGIGSLALLWATVHGPWSMVSGLVRHPGDLGAMLAQRTDSADVVAVLVVLGWMLWLWMSICTAVEVVAHIRGVHPIHLPGSAWLQKVAGLAVGAMMAAVPAIRVGTIVHRIPDPIHMTVHGGHQVSAAAGGGPRSPVSRVPLGPVTAMAPTVASEVTWQGGVGRAGLPGKAVAAMSAPGHDVDAGIGMVNEALYVVQPGDTMWSIAAAQLGSPLRWRQIAALNQGRVQPGGQRLLDDNWILPGWTLLMPPVGPVGPAVQAATVPTSMVDTADPSPISPGPRPITKGPVQDQQPIQAQPSRRQVSEFHPEENPSASPDLMPHGGQPATTYPLGSKPASDTPGQNRAKAENNGSDVDVAEHRGVDIGEGVVFAVLSAGVVMLVTRLRRVQQRHRPTGLRIALPPADAAAVEGQLRRRANPQLRRQAGMVVGLLHRAAGEWGRTVPAVAAIRVGPGGAEVAVEEVRATYRAMTEVGSSSGPIPPFVPGSAPGWWTAPTGFGGGLSSTAGIFGESGRKSESDTPMEAPSTVVSLGDDHGDLILVDLGVLSTLALNGPWASGALRAMAVELATASVADEVELVLVGCGTAFDAFDRVRTVDNLASACVLARQRIAEFASPADRAVTGDQDREREPWATTVFLCAGIGTSPIEWAQANDLEIPVTWGSNRGAGLETPGAVPQGKGTRGTELPPARRLAELAHQSGGAVVVVFGGTVPEARWQAWGTGDRVVLRRTPEWSMTRQGVRPVAGDGAGIVAFDASGGVPSAGSGSSGGAGAGADADADADADVDVEAHADAEAGGPLVTVRAQQVDVHTVEKIGLLLDTATKLTGVDIDAAPYDAVSNASSAGEPLGSDEARLGSRATVPGGDAMVALPVDQRTVQVNVLGPIQVVGNERPFTRAWSLDLVVYLALHAAGATTDQWSTALWPDRLMAPASLHSTASAARRALGTDGRGGDHLPRAHGRLQLAATVSTDWQAFQAAVATEDPDCWHQAMQLVRGRPFDGLRVVDWAILEGVLPAIESAVVDLASRLAAYYLDQRDADGANWAARRGLLVSPYDERLYRMLFRAADVGGNPAGVESAMAELIRLVAEDVEPYDAIHPETLTLYRALSRRGE